MEGKQAFSPLATMFLKICLGPCISETCVKDSFFLNFVYQFCLFMILMRCFALFSTLLQLYQNGQLTFSCFPGVSLAKTLHNILLKLFPNYKYFTLPN